MRSGFEPTTYRFPNLPEQEAGALLILPPRLVTEWVITSDIYKTCLELGFQFFGSFYAAGISNDSIFMAGERGARPINN